MIKRLAFGATLLAASGFLASPIAAQERSAAVEALDAQLPGTIINDPTRLDWGIQGQGVSIKGITGSDIPGGGAAARYTIKSAAAHAYDIAASIPILSPIKLGEDITLGFWARAVSAQSPDGRGTLGLRIQQNAAPWPGFADSTVSLGPDWKWYETTGTATVAIAKGQAFAQLQMGGAKQVIEIGQAIVVKGARIIMGSPAAQTAQLELPPQLAGKGALINHAELRNWTFNGNDASHATFDDKANFMGKATRFTAPAVGANPWDISANVPIDQAIAAGDQLLLAIAVRTVSAQTADGKGEVGIRIQDNAPPNYDGFADATFKSGPNWQLVQIKVTSPMAIPAGRAAVALHFARAQQVIDVGPVYVIKLN